MNKIAVLTHQKEIELLRQAKEGRTEYDILGVYHTASKEEIQEAFDNKVKNILETYQEKKEVKKILREQNHVTLLTNILKKDKSQKGEENKVKFREIKKAYEILYDKQKKVVHDEKNKDLFLTRSKAIRLLVFYNQSFVKYWVRRYHYYSQSDIDSEDLVFIGTAVLLNAIKEFDLSRVKEYRLATYAGHFIRRQVNEFIKESQLIPKIIKEKFCDFCKKVYKISELRELKNSPDEQGKKYICKKCLEESKNDAPNSPVWQNWSTVYYNKNYYDNEKDGSGSLLADTLKDDDSEEQIEQKRNKNKTKIDELVSNLEYHEELIIRLYFGLVPNDLAQIYRLATEKKTQRLKKLEKIFSLSEKESTPLIKSRDDKEKLVEKRDKLEKKKVKQQEGKKSNNNEIKENVQLIIELLKNPNLEKSQRKSLEESLKIFETIKKYWNFLSKPRKKETVFQQIIEPEFWEYFREFPELIAKPKKLPRVKRDNKASDLLQVWNNNQHTRTFSEKEIHRWISLGYQPEDTLDSQNQIFQKLGISKKVRQEWEAKKTKKNESWFKYHLIKKIENWKQTSLEKLKNLKE